MSRQESIPVSRYATKGRPNIDSANIVIIGNGIAGLTAALEARRYAPDKRIVMLTEQIHPTINTPSLKQFAIGKIEREQLLAYPAGTERTERIHVVTARVEYIHAQHKFVELDGGRGFGYDTLLIATGSAPRGLPPSLPGRDFDGILTLHRLQDYLDLRRRLHEVSEAVVIGGGTHAVETVMALLHRNIRVHWLIRSATFMPRTLDQHASEMVLERIRRVGANVYTETEAVGIVGRMGGVAGVMTNQEKLLSCQLVLVCTGAQPVSSLAERCDTPLRYEHGILVDDQLHTSVHDVYAAGDVAALKNPQTDIYETRAQWYAAVSQGRIAGAMMAGHEIHDDFGVQWHATQLGELSMLTVGNPLAAGSNVTGMVDTSQGGYRRMTLIEDRLVGYLSLGPTQPDGLAIKCMIDEGLPVRDITRILLKGRFDARKYLSQLRSRAARGMLVPHKIQAPGTHAPVINPPSQVKLLPIIESFAETRVTEPLTTTQPLNEEQGHYSEEDEEISPFTGNLPALPKAVESTLVPVIPPEYDERAEGETPASDLVAVPRRSSLWSYVSKELL